MGTIEENPEFANVTVTMSQNENSMKSPKQNGKWGHFSSRVQKEKMKAFENDIVRDEFE